MKEGEKKNEKKKTKQGSNTRPGYRGLDASQTGL